MSSTQIGNPEKRSDKFSYFFEMVRSKAADLVLTPEYSCPWKNIIDIVKDKTLWPAPKKLWALGCV